MLKVTLPEINVLILYSFLVLNIEFSFSLPRLNFKVILKVNNIEDTRLTL